MTDAWRSPGGVRARVNAARALLAVSRRARRSRPVFIVGAARSGTSILYRCLLQLPAFAPAIDEPDRLMESHALAWIADNPRLRPPTTWFVDGFMAHDEAALSRFYDLAWSAEPWRAAARRVADGRSLRAWRLSGEPLIVRAFFEVARAARGCARLAEKTPSNLGRAERLAVAFPRARLLVIVRHPVDVLSSFRKRGQRDAYQRPWADLGVDAFADQYRAEAADVRRLQTSIGDRFKVVRYEDFTGDPAATMRAVCAFVGEPFEAGAVRLSDEGYGRWEVDPHLYGSVVSETKDWRSFLTVEDARALEDDLGPELLQFSYDRYTNPEETRDQSCYR